MRREGDTSWKRTRSRNCGRKAEPTRIKKAWTSSLNNLRAKLILAKSLVQFSAFTGLKNAVEMIFLKVEKNNVAIS